MSKSGPSVVLLVRQVAHYHHARFVAAGRFLSQLNVLSLANEGDFVELLSSVPPDGYFVHGIYPDLARYRLAASSGAVVNDIFVRLNALQPEVVAIGGWASPESYAGLSWARANRRGVVVMSDSRAQDAPRNRMRDWVKSKVVRACDAGLAAGRVHRDYLVKLGLARDKIHLGYDVVDNQHFEKGANEARERSAEVRAELGLPRKYILASSRFIPKKNLTRLVYAYEQACVGLADPPELILLGDGPGRESLLSAADYCKHGRIHLPGFIHYDRLPLLYGLAMGFVHVPTAEQWGLVVSEAAASGLPILASEQCGAAGELVIPGRNGWRVSAADQCAIFTGLHNLFRLSSEDLSAMGKASREIAKMWGPDRFAASLAEASRLAQHSEKRLTLLERSIIRVMSRRIVETVA